MNLARNFSWYTITGMLNNAVPFILLPVLTRYLSPDEFGLLSIIVAYVAIFSPVIIFGIPTLFATDYHRLVGTELRRKSAIWFGLPFFLGGLMILMFQSLSHMLVNPMGLPEAWIPVIPLLALLGFIPQWAGVVFQMENRPRDFSVYQTTQAILLMLTAIIFIVGFDMHWEGRIWSMLIVGAIASVIGLLALRPYLSFMSPKSDDIVEAIKFGAGLLPHSVLSQLIRQSDRLFIVHFIGLSAAGEYAVGWQVASIMLVLLSTFNQAWTPFLFHKLADCDEEKKKKIVNLTYFIALAFFAMYLAVNAISPIIFSFVISEAFQNGMHFVPFITTGYLFLGFYLLVTDYIFYTKKTYILSLLTTANFVINLAMNYICVQRFGSIGVTYAFIISSFIMSFAAWFVANKVFPMPWFHWFRWRN